MPAPPNEEAKLPPPASEASASRDTDLAGGGQLQRLVGRPSRRQPLEIPETSKEQVGDAAQFVRPERYSGGAVLPDK